MDEFQVGDKVVCYRSEFGTWMKAEVLKLTYDYVCCKGTDNEHTHDLVIDVKFEDGKISQGHFPSSMKSY